MSAYSVTVSTAHGVAYGPEFFKPSVTAHAYHHLSAGTLYTFSVVAWNGVGGSAPGTARYTTPSAPPAGYVFAVDTARGAIVKVPTGGGRPTTVFPAVSSFTVDAAGNLFVVDHRTVREIPAAGSRPRTIVVGLNHPTSVQVDDAGNVYVVDPPLVKRISAGGGRVSLVAAPVDNAFVAPTGTITSLSGSFDTQKLTTFPAGGGAPTVRAIGAANPYYTVVAMTGDRLGNLYFNRLATGASGSTYWSRLTSTTEAPISTRMAYYAAAVDRANRFYLLQTVRWCPLPAEISGSCVPDRRVNEIRRTGPAGSTSVIPVMGLTLAPTTAPESLHVITVDRAGFIYVAQSGGPSAGLLRYPPTGGAPTVLATGSFTRPTVSG